MILLILALKVNLLSTRTPRSRMLSVEDKGEKIVHLLGGVLSLVLLIE